MSFSVAGIGEVLWDRFPDGDRLGGAPANFAFHAAQLGAQAHILSRVGDDTDGWRLLKALAARNLSAAHVQSDSEHLTGVVRVKLEQGQPSYIIESPSAWDHLELTPALSELAGTLDAVCFGTLAQRLPVSRQTIQDFIRLCPRESIRLFDVNLRQSYFNREVIAFGLENANALKLNGEELDHLIDLFDWPFPPEEAPAAIFRLFPIDYIAITHGADGCSVHSRHESVKLKALPITCVDAVGAGDAFSAALVTGILQKMPLSQTADRANRLAGYVAGQAGAMPPHPTEKYAS